MVVSGDERFTANDLQELSEQVVRAWTLAAESDWSVRAGTLDWSCTRTADHAVDCVYAPAFFLASRRTDAYPEIGADLTLGDRATPDLLIESLKIAIRMLIAVVKDASPDVRAVIFRRPDVLLGEPDDFVARGALELTLHAHDVCSGLGVDFELPPALVHRLREHTRPWPMWTTTWNPLGRSDDPWGDFLSASGRHRSPGDA
jgi:hypothetical protein